MGKMLVLQVVMDLGVIKPGATQEHLRFEMMRAAWNQLTNDRFVFKSVIKPRTIKSGPTTQRFICLSPRFTNEHLSIFKEIFFKTKLFKHVSSTKCISVKGEEIILEACTTGSSSQMWTLENFDPNMHQNSDDQL